MKTTSMVLVAAPNSKLRVGSQTKVCAGDFDLYRAPLLVRWLVGMSPPRLAASMFALTPPTLLRFSLEKHPGAMASMGPLKVLSSPATSSARPIVALSVGGHSQIEAIPWPWPLELAGSTGPEKSWARAAAVTHAAMLVMWLLLNPRTITNQLTISSLLST